jgi:hypothetical protein
MSSKVSLARVSFGFLRRGKGRHRNSPIFPQMEGGPTVIVTAMHAASPSSLADNGFASKVAELTRSHRRRLENPKNLQPSPRLSTRKKIAVISAQKRQLHQRDSH